MEAPKSVEEWDGLLRAVCKSTYDVTNGRAVLMLVFDAPWLSDDEGPGTSMGLYCSQDFSILDVAHQLKTIAAHIERHGVEMETARQQRREVQFEETIDPKEGSN